MEKYLAKMKHMKDFNYLFRLIIILLIYLIKGTPLILALRRQRQEDLSEFEASLVYRASYITGFEATQ